MGTTYGALAGALVGLGAGLAARTLFGGRPGSRHLRRENQDLEAKIQSGAADLRDATARLQSIIDSAVDAIIVIDRNGLVEAFSRGAERLFGYSEREVIGHNVKMLMPAPYRDEHDGYLARYHATGDARIIGLGRQVTGQRRDGSMFPAQLSVGEMEIDGEKKFTGILHDLTARVALEERLREQAALARLGEMAAVIAHEVKNPLAGVRGAIEVIGGRLPAGSRDAGVIREIVARIDALNELMKDLLLFARPPVPKPAPVEIVPLLERTAALFAQDPQLSGIQIRVNGSAPPVQADRDMLQIVFQNLLLNAAHAMEGRGQVRVAVATADSTCVVEVTDEGPGIPAEVRAKIFNAFFTTKARGSGLGLPTAKRLIEAHHGRIEVECPPQGGTTVRIALPYGTP